MTSDLTYIVPLCDNWKPDNPIRAGNLKLTCSNWAAKDAVNSHFMAVKLNSTDPGMKGFPLNACFLKGSYRKTTHHLKQSPSFEKILKVEVASCITKMNLVDRYMDSTSKVNEASVRMLAANEITLMMCAVHGFTFRVEDKMLTLDMIDEEDGGILASLVTPRSTMDYICFSVHSNFSLAAVLLETRISYHHNALAQLIGYYIRCCANIWRPGVCILLTSDSIYIVLFPFCSKSKIPLVNAICLKPIDYKRNLEQALKLLAIIVHQHFNPQMVLEDYLPVEKGLCFEIETYEKTRLRQLEDDLKEMKKGYEQLQDEVAKLKCKVVPVSIKL